MNTEAQTATEEELEELIRHLREEKDKCVATEKENIDLKKMIRLMIAPIYGGYEGDSFTLGERRLEEEIFSLKAASNIFYEMVMAVCGARIFFLLGDDEGLVDAADT